MKSPKKDRIGCCWPVALLSPLFLYIYCRLLHADVSPYTSGGAFALIFIPLIYLRAYYLDETGVTAKFLGIPYMKIRWDAVGDIQIKKIRDMLHICLMQKDGANGGYTTAIPQNSLMRHEHFLLALPIITTARVEYFEKYWGPIQNGRYFYEKMIAEDERRLKKWERGNVFQRLFAKIMRMFP